MSSTNSSTPDLTSLGVESEVERYTLISWCLITLLGSLVGNFIILLSTIRYNAIRLDKISVLLINNIAVSDIGSAVFGVHPVLVSLIWNKWSYGRIPCYVFHYLQVQFFFAAVLLICALHISKLHLLIYPLHSMGRTRRCGYLISAAMWLLSAVLPLFQMAIDRHDVSFDYRVYRCKYSFRAPVWQWLQASLTLLLLVIPQLIVVATTIALLVIVKKAKGKKNKQGAITAMYVGCVYLLSNVPVGLFITIYTNISHLVSPDVRNFFDVTVCRISYFVLFLNCMSNGFVYYRSVNSFKIFVKRAALSFFNRVLFRQVVLPSANFRMRVMNRI